MSLVQRINEKDVSVVTDIKAKILENLSKDEEYQLMFEKITTTKNITWIIVKLDNGDKLYSNIKLATDNIVQIENDKIDKYQIKNNIIDTIEEVLGYKIDLKNDKVKEFLALYGCKGRK